MSARKMASRHLGLELQKRYTALVEAPNPEEIQTAAILLGALFNENIEQIIWFLKEYGGMEQAPLERRNVPPPKRKMIDEELSMRDDLPKPPFLQN